jgi:hypothetical protein
MLFDCAYIPAAAGYRQQAAARLISFDPFATSIVIIAGAPMHEIL